MRAWIAFIITIALCVTTAVAGTNITFNGSSYTVPAVADASWGNAVSNYLIAIASGALQKTGGTFTLTQEVDFGSTYGLKAPYFKSKTSTIAGAGILRMGTSDAVSWRNAANNADLPLIVDSSNVLKFNGNPVVTLALGAGNTALLMNNGGTAYSWTTIANANVDAAAAIAYSKLNLASSVATGDLASGLLVPVGKGGTGLTAGTSGGILGYTASGTLASSGALAANGVLLGGGAGATPTATAAGSANNVFVVPNAGGAPVFGQVNVGSTSAVTGTLAIGNGGTGQTTANAAFNALSPLTTEGDLAYYHSSANARLGIGSSDQVFVSNGTDPVWGKVNVGSTLAVTGTLPIGNGGTGQTTANNAINALLPTQTSNSGKVLSTDGSNTSWASALSSTLSQFNAFIGNASNVGTATNTNLLGDILAQTSSGTVTVTIATPGVFSYTAHGMANGDRFYLTTTGALPTGLTASTTYYAANVSANAFSASTSLANVAVGTYIATSGSQSGTHTLFMGGLAIKTRAPTQQTFTSGTAQTYTTPAGVAWIRVRAIGGGGGGAGGGSGSPTSGGAGGTTSWQIPASTVLISNTGGAAGTAANAAGSAGGGSTIVSPAIGFNVSGGGGSPGGWNNSINTTYTVGGAGGNGAFGGGGHGGINTDAGQAGAPATGAGGGGGGGGLSSSSDIAGGGGGAGAFADVIIANPGATYTYSVGAAGTAGNAGTTGGAGSLGGSGAIIVEEHYY